MSIVARNPEIIRVLHRSVEIAISYNHEAVTVEHLLCSLVEEQEIIDYMRAHNVSIVNIQEELDVFLRGGFLSEAPGALPQPTRAFDEITKRALAVARVTQRGPARPVDLLYHLLEQPSGESFALNVLHKSGITAASLKRSLGISDKPEPTTAEGENAPPREITNRAEAIKLLEKYCVDLNARAGEGGIDPLIGRSEEVDHIIQIMARRTKNNVAMVGEPGVGKTAIAEGLALKIARSEVPEVLRTSVVYSLDIGALVAGTRFRGDLEERLKQVLASLTFLEAPILFIDEIHTIMGTGAGGGGTLDVANLLKPALAKGKLRCIGSTTHEEFRKHFEKDRALLRRFKKVEVVEPTVEAAKLILRGLRSSYETFHGVHYSDEALDAAVDLSARYITTALLPDKAIDIIDNVGAQQRVSPPETKKTEIGIAEIEQEVAKIARIPEKTVQEGESEKLLSLEGDLKAAVFGQDTAIDALVDAVFISRSGLRDVTKPAGAFLFAGPTGVGKSEAAKQLASTLGVPLLKYDMSEFMEKHSVSKLIGSPPGYVGYGDGAQGSGKLVNDIERSPHSILLLDEIEKAHPDVFNLFLQVFEDARLTSSSGKSVDFRNVIIILTTNAGASEAARPPLGFGAAQHGDPTAVINRTFSPEFRNRLDAVVNFSPLREEDVIRVVDKFLAVVISQAQERGVTIRIDDASKSLLGSRGHDVTMGARPLARIIHDEIKKPLSRLMVSGPLKSGGEADIKLSGDGKSLEITCVAQDVASTPLG